MLAARALAIGYRDRLVGEDLSLEVRPGETLALLGPNGGGKTTLLKTLLGLIPARAGEVTLGGAPLQRLSVTERARRIGYVPQSHAGAFAFTVAEMVLMGRTARAGLFAAPSEHDRAVARAAIERLGIAHLAERPVTMISGGERQLALIARALAQEPAIVVLDEPTASLDFGNQGKVLAEMARLAHEGLGVLFTTHDPNHALRHADRALLIRDGRALAQGPVAEVMRRPLLEQLYAAPVIEIAGDPPAFLPG